MQKKKYKVEKQNAKAEKSLQEENSQEISLKEIKGSDDLQALKDEVKGLKSEVLQLKEEYNELCVINETKEQYFKNLQEKQTSMQELLNNALNNTLIDIIKETQEKERINKTQIEKEYERFIFDMENLKQRFKHYQNAITTLENDVKNHADSLNKLKDGFNDFMPQLQKDMREKFLDIEGWIKSFCSDIRYNKLDIEQLKQQNDLLQQEIKALKQSQDNQREKSLWQIVKERIS